MQLEGADPRRQSLPGSVVDLFCGVGGLAHGFHLEGFDVAAGIDTDEDCRYPFERNNQAPFIRRDVTGLTGDDVLPLFMPDRPRVLVGCAPCQPFSRYNQKNDDPKWSLLKDFGRLIREVGPDVVSMENVPRLLDFRGGAVFREFEELLVAEKYSVSSSVVFGPAYGVPQQRSRLILLASRHGPIELIRPELDPDHYPTVEQAIAELAPLRAGEVDADDPLHRASGMSEVNLRRIRASRPGGTWRDWDPELVAQCHRSSSGRGYSSVYGRMEWHAPSPTITTQFYGFGNGRFGHPDQDRALSLREGAILQSFPPHYEFVPVGDPVHFKRVGRMIGNAVPVLLGRAVARSISTHLSRVTA